MQVEVNTKSKLLGNVQPPCTLLCMQQSSEHDALRSRNHTLGVFNSKDNLTLWPQLHAHLPDKVTDARYSLSTVIACYVSPSD